MMALPIKVNMCLFLKEKALLLHVILRGPRSNLIAWHSVNTQIFQVDLYSIYILLSNLIGSTRNSNQDF
jgi:hypothetical protein